MKLYVSKNGINTLKWMKYNYNKLPQAQQQTTNKKIITPPK